MRRLIFLLLFAVSLITLAQAQENTPPVRPRTAMGDMSLNFSINGFGSFGVTGPLVGTTPLGNTLGDSLLGMLGQLVGQRFARPVLGVGMTMFLADNLGLRLGLGFNSSSVSTPREGDTTGKEDKTSKTAFAISPALQIHLVNAGPVSVYSGVAISFATASNSQGEDSLEISASQTGFSGGAMLGAQFFPWSNVSLGVESQFGIILGSTSSEARNKSTDGPSSFDLGFTLPLSVNLGIHF